MVPFLLGKEVNPIPEEFILGRGNGWVMVALPSILDYLGDSPEREEILSCFQRTAEAIVKTQQENGMFRTLLMLPSYEETSGTALIAAGLIHGVNHGYLDQNTWMLA